MAAFARLNSRGKRLWFVSMLKSNRVLVHAVIVPQYVLFAQRRSSR
ncbi:hypothetical protein [Saccharopolyspora rhizosphaerae]|nr:hypothetical protein [Saccharopolyspora rhizosphaerae]